MKQPSSDPRLQEQVFALLRDWRFIGNLPQQPPEGDWRTWLLIGGRGSGKTRAGAEWVHGIASAGKQSDLRIALVAETLGDAREVMIDGISGICRIASAASPAAAVLLSRCRAAGSCGRMVRWRRYFPRKTPKACAARNSTWPGRMSWENGNIRRKPGTCCNSACVWAMRPGNW